MHKLKLLSFPFRKKKLPLGISLSPPHNDFRQGNHSYQKILRIFSAFFLKLFIGNRKNIRFFTTAHWEEAFHSTKNKIANKKKIVKKKGTGTMCDSDRIAGATDFELTL